MSHPYASKLVNQLEQFNNLDLSQTLGFRMQVAIRDAMVEKGATLENANLMALSVDIDLAEDSLNEEQFRRLVDLESDLMLKLVAMYQQAGFPLRDAMTMGRRMSLKLN